MKSNTKVSITLPAAEVRLVKSLTTKLRLRTNVEVVRRGLRRGLRDHRGSEPRHRQRALKRRLGALPRKLLVEVKAKLIGSATCSDSLRRPLAA